MEITRIGEEGLAAAAAIHSASWQESHRAFCTEEFVALHSPERQKEYLRRKLEAGAKLFLLTDGVPTGIVSVTGSLIEDLYVLPERQNCGYGTRLLLHAMEECEGTPVLWILENNCGAERLYRRMGFVPTGRRNAITDKLDEIEFILEKTI